MIFLFSMVKVVFNKRTEVCKQILNRAFIQAQCFFFTLFN